MNRLSLCLSDSFDVFYNQAIELYLLENVKADEVILYLWQNANTIVIGKNQDAYSECDIRSFEKDNGSLARRISGGGAVYHDTGNLNFTFITSRRDFDVPKQDEVILSALKGLGIRAEKNGRNDLLVEGKKFSGHAYHKGKDACLHHGTLMLEVDEEKLSKYLRVSKLKLHSKNVSSLRSRIINLKSVKQDLDVETMKKALITSAEEVYGLDHQRIGPVDEGKIVSYREQFKDEHWRYGRRYLLEKEKEGRFDWGTVKACFSEKDGRIEDLIVYTDAMDETLFDGFEKTLIGKKISELDSEKKEERDVIALLKEVENEI